MNSYAAPPPRDGRAVAFSDEYWTVHQELSDAGKITHKADACPGRREGALVRVWESATGWKDVLVGPTFAPKEPN